MFCTKCGNEMAEGTRFCTRCGAALATAVEENKESMNKIGSNSVTAEKAVAMSVRTETVETTVEETKQEQKLSKSGWIIGILICVLVVVLIGLAILFVKLGGIDMFAGNNVTTEERKDEEEAENEVVTTEAKTTEVEKVVDTQKNTEATSEQKAIVLEDYTEENCEELIIDLKKQEFVDSDEYDTLFDMTQTLVNAKVVEKSGRVLSKMSDGEKLQLDYRIIDATFYDDSVFRNELSLENYSECKLQEAEKLFYDTYGCNEVPDLEGYGIQVNGDTVEFMMADGDAWNRICNASVQELDDYYLVTAPYFYGSNGEASETLLGYVDVLFVKNEDSRFGVTMVYAKAYDNEIEIDAVEVSSQLESQSGKNYDADNLFDADYTTAWVEGEDGDGAGETITIYLSEPTQVYGILLFNGYLASVDLYDKNGKVTAVSVDFGDGEELHMDVPAYDLYYSTDVPSEDEFSIGNLMPRAPIVTDKIVITLESGVAGYKYEDICISELKVY